MLTTSAQYGSIDSIASQKKKQTHSTPLFPLFGILSLCVFIFLTIRYMYNYNEQENNPMNKLFAKRDRDPFRLIENRKEVVVDELIGSDVEHLSFGSDEWIDFHNQLIEENGYDTNDESVQYVFKLYDDDGDIIDDENSGDKILESRKLKKREMKREKLSGLSWYYPLEKTNN